jgi:ankyrin repeat protein
MALTKAMFCFQDTALHVASKGGHASAVVMFLDKGAEFLQNKNDQTYLDIALSNKHTDVALATVRHDRYELYGDFHTIINTANSRFRKAITTIAKCH